MKKHTFFLFCLCFSLSLFAQKEKKIEITLEHTIVSTQDTKKVRLVVVLPQDRAQRQKVESISFSTEPNKIFEKDGNRYAEFIFVNHPLEEKIAITCTMKLYKCDWKTLSKKTDVHIPDSILAEYLKSEMYIETDDEIIQKRAKTLLRKTPEKTVANIYKYIVRNIEYNEYRIASIGAKKALESGKGDCTEFSDAFIALCRACSIPARHISGYTTDWGNTPSHNWVEVYIDSIGWIPIDPTPGNSGELKSLNNRYVYLSNIRNDETLENFAFFSYSCWGKASIFTDKIFVKDL